MGQHQSAVGLCWLPHPSSVTEMKMLQHKHHGTSPHRTASLTSVCPGFSFRGTSALGERARLHHKVLGAEGITCCRKRAVVSACGASPRIWPRERQECLLSTPPQPNWEQVPAMGLEKMPRACVSSTHLISKPFFLPERGKLSKTSTAVGRGPEQSPGRGPQCWGLSVAGRLTDSCRRHASGPQCGIPGGNHRSQ